MSKRFFSTRSLNIFELTLEEWLFPKHSHNFFELVFIKKGSGSHKLNDSLFDYQTGDIFLLTPRDEHEFVIAEPTTFGFIKFTEQLFLEKVELLSDSKWRKNLDAVVLHSNAIPEAIIKNSADQDQIFRLFDMMFNEYVNPIAYSRSLLLELFGALLIIVSRNIKSTRNDKTVTEKERVGDMLSYIRQNVLNKEKIKVSVIAETFYMSPNYASIFIKKHAGVSIQQYVIQTKIKMASRLLQQTNLTITQIAQKTGFTDSSHFNRLFKKYMGCNPGGFRVR
ncbi:MAG: AraC family transcriptional regulator [Nonlabens sp.]|uniref:AraC family transcriptional regulator n=1 Tax=Nonlabens sp. TaxID=1888209 RepID=UPI003EF39AD8